MLRRADDVGVPFATMGPDAAMAVQVEATGGGSFAIDRVRIEPDLPATLSTPRLSPPCAGRRAWVERSRWGGDGLSGFL
jgi:hypothetical protein